MKFPITYCIILKDFRGNKVADTSIVATEPKEACKLFLQNLFGKHFHIHHHNDNILVTAKEALVVVDRLGSFSVGHDVFKVSFPMNVLAE